jgi:hypothetical protein
MLDKVAAVLMLLAACTTHSNTPMPDEVLAMRATCRDNPQCVFDGRDMFVDVHVTNTQSVDVGFPLAFVQKTGPSVRLIDPRTQAETYLKKNLADLALLEAFTTIAPGDSVTIPWVITAGPPNCWSSPAVDLLAEFGVSVGVRVGEKRVDWRGADTLRIASRARR